MDVVNQVLYQENQRRVLLTAFAKIMESFIGQFFCQKIVGKRPCQGVYGMEKYFKIWKQTKEDIKCIFYDLPQNVSPQFHTAKEYFCELWKQCDLEKTEKNLLKYHLPHILETLIKSLTKLYECRVFTDEMQRDLRRLAMVTQLL